MFILLMVTLPIGKAQELNNYDILAFRADYFLHALLFMPWAFLRPVNKRNAAGWLLLGLLLAVCSEGLQYFLTYRAFNINDMAANVTGILLGFALAWIWKQIRR